MTDSYAVIGNPIAHSKSPEIHRLFAEQTHQDIVYERILAPLNQFELNVEEFIKRGGKGLNITVPFKFEAFAISKTLTERARLAGAVNTLCFNENSIVGDNTDGAGLVADIVKNANTPIQGARVLLLGAGGAAYGVMLPLLEQSPQSIHIANRTISKAQEMASCFSQYGKISFSTNEELTGSYDIVINATSAGLSNSMPYVPEKVFASSSLAIDMVYANKPTPFMEYAQQQGARVRDGFGMLVEQAAESFYVWRGIKPETAPIFAFFSR